MSKRPLRVLLISAEVESFARTGGLGDVVAALARALAERGVDVVVVTPCYGVTKVPSSARFWEAPVRARVGWGAYDERELGVLEVPLGGARVCLLVNHALYGRGGIYGDGHGTFDDNAMRFAMLSRAALSISDRIWGEPSSPDGGPDVIHAHDWHAAPAVLYAKLVMGDAWRSRAVVFTIHNLAFQGVFDTSAIDALGLPREAYVHGWIAHNGALNLMKGAIELADRVTTVSETYAREILQPEQGYGLDTHLRHHAYKLAGIVNGIDSHLFDPKTDAAIAQRYDARDVAEGKRACKRALLAEHGLDGDLEAPLFGLVSRLTWQKGIDLVAENVPELVARGAKLVLVGQGEDRIEDALREAEYRYRGRVATRITFDAALARRIFAGVDFLLVPSRYEPCGLTQMYAMRYGAIPIVTAVGGLRDTVEPLDRSGARGTGIVVAGNHQMEGARALLVACLEALDAYGERSVFAAFRERAMARDSSWSSSAQKYLDLYASLVRR